MLKNSFKSIHPFPADNREVKCTVNFQVTSQNSNRELSSQVSNTEPIKGFAVTAYGLNRHKESHT